MTTERGVSSKESRSDSLRDVVLEAALKILDSEGLNLGAESISYVRVFEHIEQTYGIKVTRGSVHERIWASHDDFRREVLAKVISEAPVDYVLADGSGLAFLKQLAVEEPDSNRIRLLMANVIPNLIVSQAFNSDSYRRVQSVKALASRFNDPETASVVQSLLRERSRTRLANRRSTFRQMAGGIGLRPSPELGLSDDEASDVFFLVSWSLIAGAFLNSGAGCTAVLSELDGDVGLPTDGVPWTVLSLGLRGLSELLLEVDPGDAARRPIQDVVSITTGLRGESPRTDGGKSFEPPDPGTRRTRGELKQLVLQGGVETLLRDGINLRPESLSYAAVFAQVLEDRGLVVNRASVHKRYWSSHLEFCLEVMGLGYTAEPALDDGSGNGILAGLSAPGSDSEIDRRQQALDAILAVTRAVVTPLLESPVLRRRMLIKAAVPDQLDSPAKKALKDGIVEAEMGTVDEEAKLLKRAVLDLGFEVRPEMGLSEDKALEVMATLVHVMAVGATFEHIGGTTQEEVSVKLPRVDGSGELDEWPLVALFTRSVFEMLYQHK